MTTNKITPASIANIEQQIAKVTAQLEAARAREFTAAEKVYLSTQKAVAAAQLKVDALEAKIGTTPAALVRLKAAQTALVIQQEQFAKANETYNALQAAQEAADIFATNVAKVMSGKKLGKKIKFTKQEKAVLKEDKKAAKKIAKAEKKLAKENAKKDIKAAAKLENERALAIKPKTTTLDFAVKTPNAPIRKTVVKKAVITGNSASSTEPTPAIPIQPESNIEALTEETTAIEIIATEPLTLDSDAIETPNTNTAV